MCGHCQFFITGRFWRGGRDELYQLGLAGHGYGRDGEGSVPLEFCWHETLGGVQRLPTSDFLPGVSSHAPHDPHHGARGNFLQLIKSVTASAAYNHFTIILDVTM